MYLKSLELSGFKSFGKKEILDFNAPISAIVGPNGSGKSNIAEAFRFVLGEQSIKSMRGKKGEDLIFNGGKNTNRANRASVRVVFDNEKRVFDLDFDEVVIERVVHRDGINNYLINGSQVRLRDVVELLAAANIGSSGHHIISQGEVDRILNANPKERREMIEDALGLKVFQYKLSESHKKLEKTKENITQVEALRKEIAPHLRFLQKQVERVEKSQILKENLKKLYKEYLKRESVYLSFCDVYIKKEKVKPETELKELEKRLSAAKQILETEHKNDAKSKEIIELEEKLRAVRDKKDALARELGRLEGELSAEERRVQQHEGSEESPEKSVRFEALVNFSQEVEKWSKEAEDNGDIQNLKGIIQRIKERLSLLLKEASTASQADDKQREVLKRLKETLEEKNKEHGELLKEEEALREHYNTLKRDIEAVRDKSREAERTMFAIMSKQNEIRNILERLQVREKDLAREKDSLESELEEGTVLIGRTALSFDTHSIVNNSGAELSEEDIAQEDRSIQEKRRREIEKIKIRLEEFGGGSGEEILKEYKELEERDQFLTREISDLEESADTLKKIMAELEEKLQTQFTEGVRKINSEFQTFFSAMFGGGTASLSFIRAPRRKSVGEMLFLEESEGIPEEPEVEEGIDIHIALPRKRIKGLVMLSGGERALTSIVLLFAMSQVNPPPFLILDETDAALDEANSKRYGDMIENLAKRSQLILITHNRETMSRAHILYGVTMGESGMSKLLSIKFDEAVKVAK